MSERIAPGVRGFLAGEIAAAGGREVSFAATVDRDGVVTGARVLARGTVDMVLALPGTAARGEMLLHNHPSGHLEPSQADLNVAARLHDGGVGFGIIDNGSTELYVVVEVPHDRTVVRIDPFEVIETLGEHGPIASHHRAVRGSAQPARHGRLHRRRVQRRRRAAHGGRDRGRQVLRLPGARAGLGAGQR